MKLMVLILTLVSALSANAQSKNIVCGIVDQNSLISENTILVSVWDESQNDFVEQSIKATSAKAQEFLEVLSFNGAKLCNARLHDEAPIEICFAGTSKSTTTRSITCGENKKCVGPNCGGNGFSVNSGRGKQ